MKYINEILFLGKRTRAKSIDFKTYIEYMIIVQKKKKRKQNTRLQSNRKKTIKIDTINNKQVLNKKPTLFLI